jgi:hypothetical protein
MQETQSQVIDQVAAGTPEFPLGTQLDQAQLSELVGFAVDAFKSYWAGVDTKEEFAEQLSGYGEGYTPELGFRILRAIGSSAVLKGVENDPRQLEHVAQTEAGFQAVLAGSVLHGYNAAVNMPKAYRAVAGAEGLDLALDELIEQRPQAILTSVESLSTVIEPDKLDAKVRMAYETIKRDDSKRLSPYLLNTTVVRAVGIEKLAVDVHEAIGSGEFFNGRISPSDVKGVVELGLVDPEEGLSIALDALKKGDSFVDLRGLHKITTLADNADELWQKVQEVALEIIHDPEADTKIISGIAEDFARSYYEYYDKEFSSRVLQEVKDTRGPLVLMDMVSTLATSSDSASRELLKEIVDEAIQVFNSEPDMQKRGEIAKGLIVVIETFDPVVKRELISSYAETNPRDFTFEWRLKPKSEKTDEENEFLRESLITAINGLESSLVFGRIDTLKEWFEDGDPRLKEIILARCDELESISGLGKVDSLTNFFSRDELQEIFTKVLDRGENSWDQTSTFGAAIKVFGFREAVDMFAEQIRIKPALALNLISDNQMMLGDVELGELIQVVLEKGNTIGLVRQLDHLAYRLPKEELVSIMNRAVKLAPQELLEKLKSLQAVLDESTVSRLINDVMHHNPAVVLSSLKKLPEGFINGADEVIEYMKTDERTKLAPKYFQKIMKRLPKAEDTTAFIILSKEAKRVYMKLNKILSVEDMKGADMLIRIQASMGRSGERAELDSISLAALMAVEGLEPEFIQTADDAKRNAVVAINKRLGSNLNPEDYQALEDKLGSLVPLSMYSLFITETNKPYQANGEYLREIVNEISSGDYRSWRYGDREELINDEIIPRLTEEQYANWQEVMSIESADIVADDAASVSRRIQEVISRCLLENHTIEKLSNLEDPLGTLGEIRVELGDIGKRIGDVHRLKKSGDISEEDADTQVAELEDKKKQLEVATNVVRLSKVSPDEVVSGVLFNEKGKPTKVTIEEALGEIVERYGVEALDAFGQLESVLENFRNAATTDIGSITVSDVDDFQTTFEIGANPVGSCQHYELGRFNVGLPGYFEPSVKIISVQNDKGKLVARSVVRLASDGGGQPVMVLEPVYMSQASDDIEGAIKAHAKTKAESMGIQLFVEGKGGRQDIQIKNQRAPRIYSDVFGGVREKEAEKPSTARNGLVLIV